jgi:PAS domain S-box-containing protein
MGSPRVPPALPAIAAAYAAGTGLIILAGWALGLFSQATVPLQYLSMKANAAACFALAGASLWLYRRADGRGRSRLLAQAGGAAVALVGGLTLLEHVLAVDLGVDQLLFGDVPGPAAAPGRMAPVTAASFTVLGAALVVAGATRRRMIAAQVLSLMVGLIGLLGLLGYVYAVATLHRSLQYAMALPSSIAFIVCALGVLALRPDRGLVAVIASDTAGGAAARRLLPWAVAAPVVIGAATVAGQRAGLYDIHLGIAWMVFGNVVVFSIVVWASAYSLNRLDRGRRAATAALGESLKRVAASEGRYRALMEHANDSILIMDLSERILEVNRETERLLGRPRGEIVGRPYQDFVAPEQREDAARWGERFLAEGVVRVQSRELVRADGRRVSVEVSGSLVRLGEESAALIILHDVTERERGADAVRRSEARMRSVLDAALDAVIMMDEQGRVVSWNVRAEALFGWARDEAVGRMLAELIIPPRYREAHTRGLKRFLSTGEGPVIGRRIELTALRRDGSEFPVELTVTALWEAGAFFFSAFVADITDRKRAEAALREAEQRLQHVVSSSPAVLYSLKVDGEMLVPTWVSDNIERLIGYTAAEVAGPEWWAERLHPEDRETVMGQIPALLSEGHVAREYRFRHKDGAFRWVRDEQVLVQDAAGGREIVGSWSDVTEKRSLEAQLLQSQKIDSMGRLAGGVAHDFNNLLGVISGYGELLRKRVTADPRLSKYVEDILKAAERAAGLTRQLLAFSRKQVLQPRILDLNEVVGETERMLRRLIGEDVQLMTVFDEHLGSVRVDPGQIDQILMNLAVNARDAMPRGGRLTIETSNVLVDKAYSRQHPGADPGPYVMLSVSDTGQGMTAEVRARAFEPFFTTKEPGKGTGLGLATVHGIVKQSGGHVWLYSEPGKGTTFKIYLPRTDAPAVPAPPPPAGEPLRGLETILLVEDEGSLRELVRECLEATGYSVLEARHGAEALEICERRPAPIHLLMTDVVMPGMSGRELAERLRASRPEIRILYMSGYTDDAVVLHGVLAEDMAFLQKPFTVESLARTVRDVLDRPSGEQ